MPEYWIVSADARLVSRWHSTADPGEEFNQTISWYPPQMSAPLVIDLPELFADALG